MIDIFSYLLNINLSSLDLLTGKLLVIILFSSSSVKYYLSPRIFSIFINFPLLYISFDLFSSKFWGLLNTGKRPYSSYLIFNLFNSFDLQLTLPSFFYIFLKTSIFYSFSIFSTFYLFSIFLMRSLRSDLK
jgi:hypothetical protein